MAIDVERYRAEFPVLEKKAYLISASLGPVSTRAKRYLDEYMDVWATEGAPDPAEMRRQKIAEFNERFSGPFDALSKQFAHAVIRPVETRVRIIRALRILANKREDRPRKEHSVMPV